MNCDEMEGSAHGSLNNATFSNAPPQATPASSTIKVKGLTESDLRAILDAALLRRPEARQYIESFRRTPYDGLSANNVSSALSQLAMDYNDLASLVEEETKKVRTGSPPSCTSVRLEEKQKHEEQEDAESHKMWIWLNEQYSKEHQATSNVHSSSKSNASGTSSSETNSIADVVRELLPRDLRIVMDDARSRHPAAAANIFESKRKTIYDGLLVRDVCEGVLQLAAEFPDVAANVAKQAASHHNETSKPLKFTRDIAEACQTWSLWDDDAEVCDYDDDYGSYGIKCYYDNYDSDSESESTDSNLSLEAAEWAAKKCAEDMFNAMNKAITSICSKATIDSHPQTRVNAILAILKMAEGADDLLDEYAIAATSHLPKKLFSKPLKSLFDMMTVKETDKVLSTLGTVAEIWENSSCVFEDLLMTLYRKHHGLEPMASPPPHAGSTAAKPKPNKRLRSNSQYL